MLPQKYTEQCFGHTVDKDGLRLGGKGACQFDAANQLPDEAVIYKRRMGECIPQRIWADGHVFHQPPHSLR